MPLLYPLLVLFSVFCAVLPMLLFLAIAWWLDRYDREPLWLLGLTFLWGAFGATLLSLVGNTTAELGLAATLGAEHATTWTPIIVAPLVEEPTKALVLFVVLLSRHFDNTTDGFVYGCAAGLGFAMTENFLYYWQVASLASWDAEQGLHAWLSTVGMRTFYSAMLHATASSVVGASIGWSRFRSWPKRLVAVPLGFLLAMGIHGLWNGLLTFDEGGATSGRLTQLDMVLFPLEAAAIFTVFQLVLWAERLSIRSELRAEADAGTLPADHVPALSSFIQRGWGRWLPDAVPREAYVRATTMLAFRRRQARACPDDPFFGDEIVRLRREVRGLLAAKNA